jgi:hypothetical protein
MRRSPSIVPGIDQDVYLVLDDFGRLGCAWRETNVQDTDLEAVIDDLLEGQYSNPVRIISFNTAEGWSRDVSEDLAQELRQRCAEQMRELPVSVQEFVERRTGEACTNESQTPLSRHSRKSSWGNTQGDVTLSRQLAKSEQVGPSGPGGEAGIGGAAPEDITNSDIEARLENYLEETGYRERMLQYAPIVGWAGAILIVALIVLLIEHLQNSPLLISN